VVETAKTKTTKNNNLMCTIRLEDDTGSIEVIAFQRVLEQGSAYLEPNSAVAVNGKISLRDEKDPQLMADSIQPLSGLMARGGKSAPVQEAVPADPGGEKTLWVKIPSREDPLFEHIRLLLTMFPGNDRMILYCEKEKKKIGAHCLHHETLLAELRELCGEANVIVR
jgi:DNA polymerase-3 subunit alpha